MYYDVVFYTAIDVMSDVKPRTRDQSNHVVVETLGFPYFSWLSPLIYKANRVAKYSSCTKLNFIGKIEPLEKKLHTVQISLPII